MRVRVTNGNLKVFCYIKAQSSDLVYVDIAFEDVGAGEIIKTP